MLRLEWRCDFAGMLTLAERRVIHLRSFEAGRDEPKEDANDAANQVATRST
jgi:hypothetical protein